MEDPNWFFSTLAQSAAAIVGLIGAFLVSKTIELKREIREEIRESERKILSLKNKIDQTKLDLERIIGYYSSFVKHLEEESKKEKGSVIDYSLGISIPLPNTWLEFILDHFNKGIGLFSNKKRFYLNILVRPITALHQQEEYYRNVSQHLEIWKSYSHKLGTIDNNTLDNCFKNIIELEEQIRKIKKEYDDFINSFVLPPSLWTGLIILALLAFAFVFLPLFFLSAGSQTLVKTVLLTLFATGIFALLIFFKSQIDEIKEFVKP